MITRLFMCVDDVSLYMYFFFLLNTWLSRLSNVFIPVSHAHAPTEKVKHYLLRIFAQILENSVNAETTIVY